MILAQARDVDIGPLAVNLPAPAATVSPSRVAWSEGDGALGIWATLTESDFRRSWALTVTHTWLDGAREYAIPDFSTVPGYRVAWNLDLAEWIVNVRYPLVPGTGKTMSEMFNGTNDPVAYDGTTYLYVSQSSFAQPGDGKPERLTAVRP